MYEYLRCEPFEIFRTRAGRNCQGGGGERALGGGIFGRETRKIFIVENGSIPVGHLYMIPDLETNSFELAPAVSEKYRGKGYAKKALELGLQIGQEYGFSKLLTSIREDNTASLKVFAACGAKLLPEYRMVYIPKLGKEVKMFFVEKELN